MKKKLMSLIIFCIVYFFNTQTSFSIQIITVDTENQQTEYKLDQKDTNDAYFGQQGSSATLSSSLSNYILTYNKSLKLEDAQRIAESILMASNQYNIDYKIITALVAIESGFRHKVKSPSGAIGLGQLMPSTATWLKVKNPIDPYDNLLGTVKLLRMHLEKFDGDINFALAAYKIGAKNVQSIGIKQLSTINYIKNIRKVFDSIP